MPETTGQRINGNVWINDPEDVGGASLVEFEPAEVDVEKTDENEIAIHGILEGASQAVASLYVTRAEACLLAARLLSEAAKS